MIRFGILGCAEIAYRRFMPAVKEVNDIVVVAVAEEFAPQKLATFCTDYGIEAESDFEALLKRADIDAVYIPQPPALHYRWAKRALELNKHVFVEKPSTTSLNDTLDLISTARAEQLVLHENYMFQYHKQIRLIKELIEKGTIGEVRLIRGDFGFPIRAANDFRYKKNLGGGALFDAGGYMLKLATLFLGDTIKVDSAKAGYISPLYEVDMYGSVAMSNDNGDVFQASYGMDNEYRCSLEIWGSLGSLRTGRILTAPVGYCPTIEISTSNGTQTIRGEADSTFARSIECFCECVGNNAKREASYCEIELQARLMNDVFMRVVK